VAELADARDSKSRFH